METTVENKPVQRSEYMTGKVTFEQYYRSVYKLAGVNLEQAPIMLRVIEALKSGDEHLNTIPISIWDRMAAGGQGTITRSLRAHGDGWSLAGRVCVMKQAAKDAAKSQVNI